MTAAPPVPERPGGKPWVPSGSPAPLLTLYLGAGSAAGADFGPRQNTLLCQRAAEEVEPVLTPEHLAAVDVGRHAEHATVDRLLRERVEMHARVRRSRALLEHRRVQSARSGERAQRGDVADVPLLGPARAADRP